MLVKSYLFVCLLILATTNLINAQNSHYWSEQYGNKSMLLSGSVNASVSDLGLVYYNPGRLAQIENPAFVISGKAYELSKIKISDGLGEGRDLKQSRFSGIPSLLAGTFKIPKWKKHHFAYSLLTRSNTDIDFSQRTTLTEAELPNNSNYQQVFNKYNYHKTVNEEWYGLTWSYAANDKISVGLSTFGYQTQNSTSNILHLQGLTKDNQVHSGQFSKTLSYSSYGLLFKAGLAANLSKIKFGLTLTTPKINIAGKGKSTLENFVSGVDSLNGNKISDIYIENDQDNLQASFKSPWAIGAGIAFDINQTTIHISSEWFSKINKYTILQSDEFVGQQPPDTTQLSLVDKLNSVVNFGIGIEHRFTKKIQAFGSIATDFSAVATEGNYLYELDKNETSNANINGNLMNYGFGMALNMKRAELTVGTLYSNGSKNIPRPLNLGGPVQYNSGDVSRFTYNRWRFIVGFSFAFGKREIKF